MKRKLLAVKFEIVSVLKALDQFYKELSKQNSDSFLWLWVMRYLEELLFILDRHIAKEKDEDAIEEILEMSLMDLSVKNSVRYGDYQKIADDLQKVERIPESSKIAKTAKKHLDYILSEPNSVTQVVYETEVLRKRDRAKEAVEATIGIRNKQIEMDRQLIQWSRFTGWYSDIITEDACESAIQDAGVKYVRWVSQNDDKVCGECNDLDGRVFEAVNVPPHPHRNCRCTVTPVKRR